MSEFYVAILGAGCQDLRSAAGPEPTLALALAALDRMPKSAVGAPKEKTTVGTYFACQVLDSPDGCSSVLGPYPTQVDAHQGILDEINEGGAATFNALSDSPLFVAVARLVATWAGAPKAEAVVLERLG